MWWGAQRRAGTLPRPRLRPASGPRPTPGSASTPPRFGRGPFLPQLVPWGRGAARRCLYGPGSQRKENRQRTGTCPEVGGKVTPSVPYNPAGTLQCPLSMEFAFDAERHVTHPSL